MPSLNPDCQDCPLWENARTVCIAGTGPRNAKLMIVGEAPGAVEDDLGIPFVGKAGQLLDALLKEQGFNREDVYITNAVKCRPPSNRDPSAAEIKACAPYLKTEIETVRPRLIVSLGNHALKSLTGETGITKHRGSLLPLHRRFGSESVSVFSATHPAAALYYPDFIEQIRDDLILLRHTVNDDFVEIDAPWCENTPQFREGADLDVIGFDLETNAAETRDPFAQIYLCGVDGGFAKVDMFTNYRQAVMALAGAARAGARMTGHNASAFDRLHIRRATGFDLHCDDTMLMGWLLHETWGNARRLNLESLAVAELGVRPWKRMVTWDWSKPATIDWPTAKQYCAYDTRVGRQLFIALEKQLKTDGQLWNVYDKLYLPASRALADMEERGLYINNANVREAREYYTEKAAKHYGHLQVLGERHDIAHFNPGSTQQVSKLLYDVLNYEVLETTPKGKPSTNVGVLKTLRETYPDPLFDHLLQYRKCRNKMLGTYIAHYENEQDRNAMAYPWYSLINTVNARTASNWQQIPREPRIRRGIAAPPGAVLLEADYSQIEMRVASSGYVFDEPNLRLAFERGLDVHTLLASEITGKPESAISKVERDNAKPPNYMFLYGGEEETYIRTLLEDSDIVKPFAQARAERNAFFRRWPGLPAGHERVVRALEREGRVRTLFGTLRRLPNVYSDDRSVKVAAYREAVNAVVAGPTCHMALIGLVLLGQCGLAVHSFQHDGYLIWVEDSEAAVRSAAAQIRHVLERGVLEIMASVFGIDWDVPLKIDLHCGTAWTENDRAAWVA